MLPFNSLSTHEFAPHRSAIAAADGAPPTTRGSGVNADGYESVSASMNKDAGPGTSVTATVYYWDDVKGAFVASSDTATLTNGSGAFSFNPKGRVFWIGVTSITGGDGTTRLSINCRAAPQRLAEGY